MKELARLVVRISNAILDSVNRRRKRDAANNAPSNISNGGRVRRSEASISGLPEQSGCDSNEG